MIEDATGDRVPLGNTIRHGATCDLGADLHPFAPLGRRRKPAAPPSTLFAGLSKRVDLKLVSRLEFDSGAVAMRYEPRR